MTQLVQYFAIVGDGETVLEPSGLARRTHTPDGNVDEAFRRDLTWQRDSAIYEWECGDVGADVVEISEEQARRLVERFREKWERE